MGINRPVISWYSASTKEDWRDLFNHFGYISVEFEYAERLPYYFYRSGWEDCPLAILEESTPDEFLAQARFLGDITTKTYPQFHPGGHFYRVIAE